MNLPIETPRLILRRYRESDIPHVVAYSSHPSIARVVNWRSPEGMITPASVGSYIQSQSAIQPGDSQWLDLAVALKPDDEVIGSVGIICRDHRQGETGWVLSTRHQGHGLATEAAAAMLEYGFTQLDLHRIFAATTSWNERSWRLMERLGMRREACFRESECVNGEWRDGLIYAILRREWVQRQAR